MSTSPHTDIQSEWAEVRETYREEEALVAVDVAMEELLDRLREWEAICATQQSECEVGGQEGFSVFDVDYGTLCMVFAKLELLLRR